MGDAPGNVATQPDPREYFRHHIASWFTEYGRRYPWRDTANPYHILVAERMLHRTRSNQVADTYYRFLDRFPTVQSLAAASSEDVTSILATLGLTWRFETFIPMARMIVESFEGPIPTAREDLLKLPGVGLYTADAVLAFAFQRLIAVVDTNTIRVAGRYLTGEEWRGDNRKRNSVRAAANPAGSNAAILDLGALICQARAPICGHCPVPSMCMRALQHFDSSAAT